MNRKFLLVTASLLVISANSVFAQNENATTDKSEHNTNWFIGGGLGINNMSSIFTNGEGNGFDTSTKFSGELNFGRWFTPRFGIRFGVQGGQWAPKKGVSQTINTMSGTYSHGDLMWSAAKWFTPYAHAGIYNMWMDNKNHSMQNEVAAGYGFILSNNLTDQLALYADVRQTIFPERVADVKDSRFTSNIFTQIGLRYSFERDGQSTGRFSDNFAEPSSTRIAKYFNEDWFLTAGAGLNTLNSVNGYGWSGRITPYAELGLGRWLSNTFAVRLGFQGGTLSHWGEDAPESTYISSQERDGRVLDKEKFAYVYDHVDFMWDVTSMIGGYDSNRPWTFMPYLHAGYINNISINTNKLTNNEWTGGAGLFNMLRVNDKTSIYVDGRANLINHALTNNKNDGYTFALAASAGLVYDLGNQYVRPDSFTRDHSERYSKDKTQPAYHQPKAPREPGEGNGNWFIGGGLGVNSMYSIFTNGDGNGLDTHLTPSAEFFFGKWYSPRVGVRFGFQGIQWAPKRGVSETVNNMTGIYTHGDLLYSAASWITPYVHAGIYNMWMDNKSHTAQNEVAAGYGVILSRNLTNQLALYGDLRQTFFPQRVADVKDSRYTGITSANIGVRYSFQRVGDDTGRFVGNFRTPATTRTTELFWDDMFATVGGGVNTINSMNGYGWSGRVTPTAEFAFGKWISNTFALRLGFQGGTLSHWGEDAPESTLMEHGIYKNQHLDKEKFAYVYDHLDMMWDVTSMIGGYDPERVVTVMPYLHGGYINSYSINKHSLLNNEWAGGIGLFNTLRLNDKVSLYLDGRAYLLNHDLTSNENDGYTFALSATGGLFYDLGRQNVRYHGDGEYIPKKERTLNVPHYGPYIYNGIADNWFIGAAAGVSALATTGADAGFNGKASSAIEIYAGKWFSPDFGGRLGYQGFELSFWGNKPGYNEYESGKFNGKDMYKETTKYAYIHGDVMWNILNTVKGYKEERAVELIPYAHTGLWNTRSKNYKNSSLTNFGTGAGVATAVAVSDRVKFNVDLRYTYLNGLASGDLEEGSAHNLTALAGFAVDLGKNYWGPGAGILLNDFWENWFVQAAGGIQTIANADTPGGFNGRFTPSEEIMIGKWFSPSVGIRGGLQGVSLSEWGTGSQADVAYVSGSHGSRNMTIEKFSSNYIHADIMWNVLNTFNYTDERTFDLIPYIHTGIMKPFTSNSSKGAKMDNELAMGGGLILSKDLDTKVSLYTDIRANAYKSRMTHDDNAGIAWGASASIGLTYNLGKNKDEYYDSNSWRHLPQDKFDQEAPAKRWAVSTNILDWADYGTANVEVQRVLGRHITTDMIGKMNLWNFKDNTIRDHRQDFQLGVRYWPWYTYSGIWFKGFAQVEEYATSGLKKFNTIGRSNEPERGSAYGAGIGFGYSLMLKAHLNLDFGVSGWAGYRDYFRFSDTSFTRATSHDSKMFISPVDANISIMFVF